MTPSSDDELARRTLLGDPSGVLRTVTVILESNKNNCYAINFYYMCIYCFKYAAKKINKFNRNYLLAPASLSSSFNGGSASFALFTFGSLYVHLVQCFSSPN